MKIYTKKWQANGSISGRSMVEMLGVLAVIGVLSAGALAGYSKAMFKHKVNQSIDIFQGVIRRLIELDQTNLGLGDAGWIDTPEEIIQYGILPDCHSTQGYATEMGCQLPIGVLDVDLCSGEHGLCGLVQITFNDVNSCIAFSSAPWHEVIPMDFYKGGPGSGYLLVGDWEYRYQGNSTDTWNLLKVTDACQNNCDDSCRLTINIREY